jgi:RHS repeat-associated protein
MARTVLASSEIIVSDKELKQNILSRLHFGKAAYLSENLHQGFDGIKAALCLGLMEAKSNTASGMPVCLWQEGIGSRCSGKERDAETGLDFFLARYYSSAEGRFITPDWSSRPEPVPYARLNNPQTLNLYTYVQNNPLARIDPDGHVDCSGKHAKEKGCKSITQWNAEHDNLSDESKTAIAKSVLTDKNKVEFSNAVVNAAAKNSVNPNLIVGLGAKESGINPNAASGKARGIFQIQPGQQQFLKLTNEQVGSVSGAVPAVAGYFSRYIETFGSRKGQEFGESLAIASWTLGVQNTLDIFNKNGITGIRNADLNDSDHHKVGVDYIDPIQEFK